MQVQAWSGLNLLSVSRRKWKDATHFSWVQRLAVLAFSVCSWVIGISSWLMSRFVARLAYGEGGRSNIHDQSHKRRASKKSELTRCLLVLPSLLVLSIKLASIRFQHIPAMQTTDTKLFIQTIIFLKAKKKIIDKSHCWYACLMK